MDDLIINLKKGEKIFFASDFHLGTPDLYSSIAREKKIVAWLESIKKEAHTIFLLGDIFDFWFEYRKVVPKGFIRLLGKLAELSDQGIQIILFTGNHDLWMRDYLTSEMNVKIFKSEIRMVVGEKSFLIGHGDGLGPGDKMYKLLKKVFVNPLAQWMFSILPPVFGMGLAHSWSRKSRVSSNKSGEKFYGEDEFLLQYCNQVESQNHHDFYVFGHRHLLLDLKVGARSRYINLGEWVNNSNYAEFDGVDLHLRVFV